MDLGGLRIVPALLALTIILVAVGLAAAACAVAVDDGKCYRALCVLGITCGIAAVALLITSAGVSQRHSNDHCHALGGVLDPGGDHQCVKPHSFIDA